MCNHLCYICNQKDIFKLLPSSIDTKTSHNLYLLVVYHVAFLPSYSLLLLFFYQPCGLSLFRPQVLRGGQCSRTASLTLFNTRELFYLDCLILGFISLYLIYTCVRLLNTYILPLFRCFSYLDTSFPSLYLSSVSRIERSFKYFVCFSSKSYQVPSLSY